MSRGISHCAIGAITAWLLITTVATAAPPAVSFDGGGLVDSGSREIGLAAGDFNEDGWDDIATANSNGTTDLLLNRTDNWFVMALGFPMSAPGIAQSVATGDFDSDGHLDDAVAAFNGSGTGTVTVVLGNGAGGVTSTAGHPIVGQPFDIATDDLDSDGDLDLVTANQANLSTEPFPSVSVLLGNGDGSFGAATNVGTGAANALTRGLAVGDVTGDGHPDVVVVNSNTDEIRILVGDGAGHVTLSGTAYGTTRGPRRVALADLDNDGDLDLATADSGDVIPGPVSNNRSTVYLNDGSGGFTQAVGSPFTTGAAQSSPFAVKTSDLNGDGNADLALANRRGGTLSVLLGDGEGGFAAPMSLPYPEDYSDADVTDLTVGDVDHDGRPDLIGNASGIPGFVVPFRNTTTLAAPAALSVDPPSPGASGTPRITGTSAGETVRLFETSGCSGPPAAQGTKAQFEGAGIEVSVAAGDTKTFYANATNAAGWATSECSGSSVTYVHKAPPAAPSGLVTSPSSPSDSLHPLVRGAAEAGSTVALFATADCTGSPIGTGSAEDFGASGIEVTVSAGTTGLRAIATDALGSASTCSDVATYTAQAPTVAVKPLLTGKAQAGAGLSVTSGTWAGIVRATTYQWLRCNLTGVTCTPVGTNSPTYTISAADANSRLKVNVTAGNDLGSTSSLSGLSAVVILR